MKKKLLAALIVIVTINVIAPLLTVSACGLCEDDCRAYRPPVDISDALEILRSLAGLENNASIETHDFNLNGELDIVDALIVLRSLAKLEEPIRVMDACNFIEMGSFFDMDSLLMRITDTKGYWCNHESVSVYERNEVHNYTLPPEIDTEWITHILNESGYNDSGFAPEFGINFVLLRVDRSRTHIFREVYRKREFVLPESPGTYILRISTIRTEVNEWEVVAIEFVIDVAFVLPTI